MKCPYLGPPETAQNNIEEAECIAFLRKVRSTTYKTTDTWTHIICHSGEYRASQAIASRGKIITSHSLVGYAYSCECNFRDIASAYLIMMKKLNRQIRERKRMITCLCVYRIWYYRRRIAFVIYVRLRYLARSLACNESSLKRDAHIYRIVSVLFWV